MHGSFGTELTYDAAGRRVTAVTEVFGGSTIETDSYHFAADGTLYQTDIVSGGTTRHAYSTMDTMGRVTLYRETDAAGTTEYYKREATYDYDSLVTHDVVTSLRTDNKTDIRTTDYTYTANLDGDPALEFLGGVVTSTATTETLTDGPTTHTGSSYAYAWFSGAVEATELYDGDTTDSGNGLYTSTLVRDAREDLIYADIHDGVMRSVRYQSTVDGLVTQRDTVGAGAAPHARYWYFGGVQMGDVSNDGTSNVDYVTAIARHRAVPGSGFFTNGATAGVHVGDFDQSYDPINGLSYESAPSSLTVRDGDTLSSIAQEVWGDASFWYLIAQANGLDSTSELTAGQVLSIPNRVANAHNSSDTYSVYDPNEHIGNISPTHPPRPENHGCGAFGQILMLLVAVVVAAVLPGIGDFVAGGLVGMGVGPVTAGIIGGAISSAVVAAIGDAAGQAVGLAVGAIKSFNWNEVGMTALSAFIGGPPSGMSLPGAIVVGALGNAITQGIAVATGLQKSFDWGGVAAAGISAGVIHEVTGALSTTVDGQTVPGDLGLGSYNGAAVHAIGGMAGAIANAATRSLVNGSDFGDNIVKALPTVIAQTLGEGLLTAIADSRQHDPQPQADSIGRGGWAQQPPTPQASASLAARSTFPGMYGTIHYQGADGGVQATTAGSVSGSIGLGKISGDLDIETVVVTGVNEGGNFLDGLLHYTEFVGGVGAGAVERAADTAWGILKAGYNLVLGGPGAVLEDAGVEVPSWAPNTHHVTEPLGQAVEGAWDYSTTHTAREARADFEHWVGEGWKEGVTDQIGQGNYFTAGENIGGAGFDVATIVLPAAVGAIGKASMLARGLRLEKAVDVATAAKTAAPALDWSLVSKSGETRMDHIMLHGVDDTTKEFHGVFSDDPIRTTQEAWQKAFDLKISPTQNGKVFDVPMGKQVGWQGGYLGSRVPLATVRLVVVPGTTKIVTAYPH